MTLPETNLLARYLSSDSKEASEPRLARAREIYRSVQAEGAEEAAACLDSAARLVRRFAPQSDPAIHKEVMGVVSLALAAVESCVARAAGQASVVEQPTPELKAMEDTVLGQMLVRLGHATDEQVEKALVTHEKMGLPIGECLLLQGVSPDHLLSTLDLQRELRETPDPDARNRAEVNRRMRETYADLAAEYGAAEEQEAGIDVNRALFLGEVLLGAGMIQREQLEQAMHVHHHDRIRIGQALLKIGALTEEQLERGLELHAGLQRAAGLKA